MDLYRETYGDLSQIQETGLYTIYNKESHTWNQVAAVVDEGTGEITAMYSNMVGASAGWSESMAKDAEKMIKKADDAIELDTSNMTLEEVVDQVLTLINKTREE